MKNKGRALCKAFLWCFIILLFPITSGMISVLRSLDTVETLFLQGLFMALSLIPPAAAAIKRKWSGKELGFAPIDLPKLKKALYFVPLLVIFIPAAMKGFQIRSAGYALGSMFLYLMVGISEEVYFRGIIPRYLREGFSVNGVLLLSTAVFAVGHMATAFSGSSPFEVGLSVLNAFLFGALAMEMTLLSANLIPAILLHFLFDFETKIVVMGGSELLLAECVRGALMFILALWLGSLIRKEKVVS